MKTLDLFVAILAGLFAVLGVTLLIIPFFLMGYNMWCNCESFEIGRVLSLFEFAIGFIILCGVFCGLRELTNK